MPLGILFWILMIIWLFFGYWGNRARPFVDWGGPYLLEFLLIGLLAAKQCALTIKFN